MRCKVDFEPPRLRLESGDPGVQRARFGVEGGMAGVAGRKGEIEADGSVRAGSPVEGREAGRERQGQVGPSPLLGQQPLLAQLSDGDRQEPQGAAAHGGGRRGSRRVERELGPAEACGTAARERCKLRTVRPFVSPRLEALQAGGAHSVIGPQHVDVLDEVGGPHAQGLLSLGLDVPVTALILPIVLFVAGLRLVRRGG